jgi:hypothetical protein
LHSLHFFKGSSSVSRMSASAGSASAGVTARQAGGRSALLTTSCLYGGPQARSASRPEPARRSAPGVRQCARQCRANRLGSPLACSPHPQPAGRRLWADDRSRLRKAFLRAPTRCPEAGGQGSAGPSAAWMPRKSLVWCSCPLKSLFGGQNRRTPRRALGPYPDL